MLAGSSPTSWRGGRWLRGFLMVSKVKARPGKMGSRFIMVYLSPNVWSKRG